MALDVSGQVYELREVVLRDKPPEMLRVSPKGTVPVLIDAGGTVIDESLDIMLWALKRNDPERWLTSETDSLDAMLSLIARFDTHFKDHLDRYKYPTRFPGAAADAGRAGACLDMQTLETRLARAPYLCGARISLTDVAIAPFVRQFANVDTGWFAKQPWPSVQRWLATIITSERFAKIMRPDALRALTSA
jgi:glutathione S-transferase